MDFKVDEERGLLSGARRESGPHDVDHRLPVVDFDFITDPLGRSVKERVATI